MWRDSWTEELRRYLFEALSNRNAVERAGKLAEDVRFVGGAIVLAGVAIAWVADCPPPNDQT